MKRYLPLLIVTSIIGSLFFLLINNHYEYFRKVNDDYDAGVSINLSGKVNKEKLSDMLIERGYIDSREESDFIAGKLAYGVSKGFVLDNIHSLKKNVWKVKWSEANALKNSSINSRYNKALEDLGLKDSVDARLVSNNYVFDYGHKDGFVINVHIAEKDTLAGYFANLLGNNMKAADSVLVCLRKHQMLTLPADEDKGLEERDTLINETVAYARTNKDGNVVFKGLDGDVSYSVLPISLGYEYGSAKGTVGGTLRDKSDDGVLDLSFTQNEHKVTLFGNITLNKIKADNALTVRSPKEYMTTLFKELFIFFAVWWGAVLLFAIRKRKFDAPIVSLLMLLTGFCILNMFSLNDPLTDKMLGVDMANGVFIGVGIIVLLYNIDFVKFYQNRLALNFDFPLDMVLWVLKPFKRKVSYLTKLLREGNALSKTFALFLLLPCLPFLLLDLLFITRVYSPIEKVLAKAPKGIGYIVLGVLLTILLFSPLGQAVGGMRVNLNIGVLFQPSEITKYLIVFFMAAYFSRNADKIVMYSDSGNASLFGNKLKSLGWIIVGLGVLMVLYLALGDMGPALVLAFTFILMYSIIKSKVEYYDENGKLVFSRILTSDIAVLVYGVLSFIIMLCLGSALGSIFLGGLVWFIVWIPLGLAMSNRVFESPILFNLIIFAFIFGGQMLSAIGPLEEAGERLESRKNMCANVWGELGIYGGEVEPGENTQVAEGLWALASGGVFGKGLAEGDPHEIPAFHTDMVLESIGEQMGFIGILVVVVALAYLLRRILVAGFRTSHPFAFYLCLGIAIVTAIQFLVISLGSTGMIPLTGVTVPFFSYGKVSMILNLAAMGVVLAISSRTSSENVVSNEAVVELNRKNVGKYTYSLSVLIIAYIAMMFVVLGVFLNYQLFNRDETLVRPLFVKSDNGSTIIEYNPRIFTVSEKMFAGNIYDRNGVLVATSDYAKLQKGYEELEKDPIYESFGFERLKNDHRQRYYPFGEHLYFMLGDANSKLLFYASESNGVGYVAECQHLSDLRGYDNTLRYENNKPVTVMLSSVYRPSKFIEYCDTINDNETVIRDYSRLVPFLESGDYAVEKFNEEGSFFGLEPKDLQLTIDAKLQVALQKEMEEFVNSGMEKDIKNTNLIRMSVVVLDAKNGDLLASSVYPLPDYRRLESEEGMAYSDRGKGSDWKAYSDKDLGLRFPSHPGSTAKVASAISGVNGLGAKQLDSVEYIVTKSQRTGEEPSGVVDLERALVESSNCFFINLVNEYDLYTQLRDVYGKTGVSLYGERPYVLRYNEYDAEWGKTLLDDSETAIRRYNKYIKDFKSGKLAESSKKMIKHANWLVTWGQGDVDATPLAIARLASVVANEGKMPVTRYLMTDKDSSVVVSTPEDVALVKKYMVQEAKEHYAKTELTMTSGKVGGKTGTAERDFDAKGRKNDVWYMCFTDEATVPSKPIGETDIVSKESSLAIVVRVERLNNRSYSDIPKGFVKKRIMPLLKKLNYGDFLSGEK